MDAHCSSSEGGLAIPAVGIDYGFLNDRQDGEPVESAPILVTKALPDRWISGSMVPRKGDEEFAAHRLKAEVLGTGAKQVVIRSDQEPAILSLKEAEAARALQEGVVVKFEESAVADSRGNGLAEAGVREIKNLSRSLLSALNAAYKHTLTGEDALVVWLVRYAGQALKRFRRGADGKTADELRRGRPFERKVPPFGEKVLYQIPGVISGPARVEPRWDDGFFLGFQRPDRRSLCRTRRWQCPEGANHKAPGSQRKA